jgi:hypothetical protein
MLDISLLLTEIKKNIYIRNEILHVNSSTHNAVIPCYKLAGRLKSEHAR